MTTITTIRDILSEILVDSDWTGPRAAVDAIERGDNGYRMADYFGCLRDGGLSSYATREELLDAMRESYLGEDSDGVGVELPVE